jgi:hypothetical protein
LLLALGVRLIAMLMGSLRMLLGTLGMLLALGVIALAMMVGRRAMGLGGVLVMFGRLVVLVSCHFALLDLLPAGVKSAPSIRFLPKEIYWRRAVIPPDTALRSA